MTTQEIERTAHAATVALADFDRAGVTTVLQTVPALAQTLRELLAAVTAPTPPADDVREALAVEAAARAIFSGYVGETPGGFEKQTYAYDRKKAEHAARRALAAAAEVRPRGTVTDAESWEYVPGEIWVDRAGLTHVSVQAGTIAPDYVRTYIEEGGEVLRRRVGVWETVTEAIAPSFPYETARGVPIRHAEANTPNHENRGL